MNRRTAPLLAAPACRPADYLRHLLLALLLWPSISQADGAALESLQSFLYKQARSLGDEVQIEVFEPAARFPACSDPQPFLPDAAQAPLGRVSVGLRCGDDPRKVRYFTAQVAVIGEYLTLAEAVQPGTPLGPELLVTRRGDLSKLPPNALRKAAEAAGLVTRQRLQAGAVLQRQHLQTVTLVEPGREVTIEATGRGFAIRQTGRALERGGLGDSVRVRLPQGRSLQAVVSGQDRVALTP